MFSTLDRKVFFEKIILQFFIYVELRTLRGWPNKRPYPQESSQVWSQPDLQLAKCELLQTRKLLERHLVRWQSQHLSSGLRSRKFDNDNDWRHLALDQGLVQNAHLNRLWGEMVYTFIFYKMLFKTNWDSRFNILSRILSVYVAFFTHLTYDGYDDKAFFVFRFKSSFEALPFATPTSFPLWLRSTGLEWRPSEITNSNK